MSKAMKSLSELFVHELKDIYYAEKKILKALPKMAKTATSPELKAGFEKHRRETEGQVERLERVFRELELPAKGKKCPGIDGIIEEGEELMADDHDPAVMDAGLIGGAQRVEHYEICVYGILCSFAKQLGYTNVVRLLEQTLREEEATDENLSRLAESQVNPAAAEAGEVEV